MGTHVRKICRVAWAPQQRNPLCNMGTHSRGIRCIGISSVETRRIGLKRNQVIKALISSSAFVMPPMPNFSTRTLATLGDRNAGRSVQDECFHAQVQQRKKDNNRFLLVPRDVVHDRQFINIIQAEHLLSFNAITARE